MKLATHASPLITSNGLDPNASVMSMTASAALQLAEHLRDTVYKDKVLAVVREYATNALDEHARFNVNKPVELHLQVGTNNCEFVVRDFAKGLSEDNVRNIFGMYGESTKLKSNKMAGCFGIGSKAGHCYAESFTVVSYFEGEKTVYSCALGGNEEGHSVGYIYRIDSEPTTETGLEIRIPVKDRDLEIFQSTIHKFVYFSPKNIVAHVPNRTFRPAKTLLKTVVDGITIRKIETHENNTHWNNRVYIQMGGVIYSAEKDSKDCARGIIVVDLPIGSMSVALSRETFQQTASNQEMLVKVKSILYDLYVKDLTKAKEKPLSDYFSEQINEMFKNAAALTGMFRRFNDFVGEWYLVPCSAFLGDMVQVMRNSFAVKAKESSDISTLEKDANGKYTLIIIPDNSASNYWKTKVRLYAEETGKSLLWMHDFYPYTIKDDPMLHQLFNVVLAKQYKFPQKTKIKTAAAVYKNGVKVGMMTPEELINKIRGSMSLPVENDPDKLKKWIEETKKNLDERTFKKFTIYNCSTRSGSYVVQSTAFMTICVKEYGLIEANSDEYQKLRSSFLAQEEIQNKKENVLRIIKFNCFGFSDKTKRIAKNKENAFRLLKKIEDLTREHSLRGKTLNALKYTCERSYYVNTEMKREDIRQLLKLKQ